ncbi:MAG: cbb3-type cytochrome c oxidase N-terminal domain-containing protein [Marinoscillum sp.]
MNYPKAFTILVSLLATPALVNGQVAAEDVYTTYQVEIVVGVAAVVATLALFALITSLYALQALMGTRRPAEVKSSETFWKRFWNSMNKAVPIEEEATVMTDHSYDGIRELDNRLPPWWLYGFYLTIIFGIVYILHYHVFDTGKLQEEEYVTEMAEAKEAVQAYLASMDNLIDESSVSFTEDELDLATGQEIFISKCAACHGQQGEGGVGPNLTDKYWLHGGDIQSIFKTIKYGVPSKGMISWQSQLSPKEMQQVSSFIYTLEGNNPPNQKEPQGEEFIRTEAEPKQEQEAGM